MSPQPSAAGSTHLTASSAVGTLAGPACASGRECRMGAGGRDHVGWGRCIAENGCQISREQVHFSYIPRMDNNKSVWRAAFSSTESGDTID